MGAILTFDFSILEFIQANLRSGFGDACMSFITHLGDGSAVWIVLAALLLLFSKTRRAGAVVMLAIVLEVIFCNFILKPFVAQPRPFEMKPAVELLITRPAGFSFPSGHTGASFAAAAALCRCKNRLWIPAVVLAALIGFSRLYLYVHYPTDVLAGMMLGVLCGWAAAGIVKLGEKKLHGNPVCLSEIEERKNK